MCPERTSCCGESSCYHCSFTSATLCCDRFVYYETLVTALKQLGLKTEVISYDELRLEKQKQTLYGLIETAALLHTPGEGAAPVKRTSAPGPARWRRVQSRILGDFVPSQTKLPSTNTASNTANTGARLLELMERAAAANTARKTMKL